MPENILPTKPPSNTKAKKKKKKKVKRVSAVAVILVIILTMVLIGLGEKFMSDLNRWVNPAYAQHGGDYYYRTSLEIDSSTTSYTEEQYELYRLGIHTAFVIPVLLAGFLAYFIAYYKRPWSPRRLVVWPYFSFSIWMTLHIVFEAFYFLIKQYETVGIYIVFIVLVGLLTWLALFIQKKYSEKHNPEPPPTPEPGDNN